MANTDHLAVGDTFQVPVPGTGMRTLRTIQVVALPGDPEHFSGGAPDPENIVIVRINGGSHTAVHAKWLAPEHITREEQS